MNTTRSHDRSVIVIPARLGSTRLPRKMLLRDTGKTLVQHTWEVACASAQADRVIIATDSDEILREVERFGGKAVLTDPAATSGTERIVEILPHFPDADVIVNLQGDEPELDPHAINLLIDLLMRTPTAGMATLVTPIVRREDLDDPSAVKAVLTPWCERYDQRESTVPNTWRAIYFSRAAVPFSRDWNDSLLVASPPLYWQHIGLYAYRPWVLNAWQSLRHSRLASHESLEQLRLVEAGIPIVATVVPHGFRGIDTPTEYAAFVARQKAHK